MAERSFEINERDFIAAQRLMLTSNRGVRRFRMISALFLAALSVAAATAACARLIDTDWTIFVLIALGWMLWLAILYRTKMGFPRTWRKIYNQQRSLHEPRELSWSADGFRLDSPSSHRTARWRELVGWKEDGETLLFLYSDVVIDILPKRQFRDEEVADLRDRLAAAAVPRG